MDFVCFEAPLVIEVDGPLHECSEQRLRAAERDRFLGEQGFRVLRFDVTTMDNLPRVVQTIRGALAHPSPDP